MKNKNNHAVYTASPVSDYQGNPFIEALPVIFEAKDTIQAIKGTIEFKLSDRQLPNNTRAHIISQLLNNFFHPIKRHLTLEQKISIMLRKGYVGRNITTGDLNRHLQNSFEHIQSNDFNASRHTDLISIAQSLVFIGFSGSGKTTTLNRILKNYLQKIYHPEHNFTQLVYLKIDCPYNGSLKSLYLSFFSAVDRALGTNYEQQYTQKRHNEQKLLQLMGHIAHLHAIGLLVIDEIQHLMANRSKNSDEMLNFFVTLVNVYSLPIIMVGTPKASNIFERDLRSSRRAVGFGSIHWEPIKNEPAIKTPDGKVRKSEWMTFTDALWKYQWLRKADLLLSEELRQCWFDLTQGILDVTVKLFVLAQIRAIESGLERITVKLLQNTYQEDFKPIHHIIDALRSGDARRIAQYPDLITPEIDRQLLKLFSKIEESAIEQEDELAEYQGHDESIRLHNLLLELGYETKLLIPMVKKIFTEYPDKHLTELLPIIMDWLKQDIDPIKDASLSKPKTPKSNLLQFNQWHTLDSVDLRFQFSQKENDQSFYDHLKTQTDLIFDISHWIKEVS